MMKPPSFQILYPTRVILTERYWLISGERRRAAVSGYIRQNQLRLPLSQDGRNVFFSPPCVSVTRDPTTVQEAIAPSDKVISTSGALL